MQHTCKYIVSIIAVLGTNISINSSDGWNLSTQEKLEGLSVDIEEHLDWCIDMLQTMNSKKTAGQMAQEQVQ